MAPTTPPTVTPDLIEQAHQLYGQLTGQNLTLRFDRQRLWYEFLRAGFTLQDLAQVVRYLQKEIRQTRRNVGALKLSNLLQLDRFEEDLNISRFRLAPPAPPSPCNLATVSSLSPTEQESGRQRAAHLLHDLKNQLRRGQI